jgi:hypothetical protein
MFEVFETRVSAEQECGSEVIDFFWFDKSLSTDKSIKRTEDGKWRRPDRGLKKWETVMRIG